MKHAGQGYNHSDLQGKTGCVPEPGHGKAEGTLEGPSYDWFDPWIDYGFCFVS